MYRDYTELSRENIENYTWCIYGLGIFSALSNNASA